MKQLFKISLIQISLLFCNQLIADGYEPYSKEDFDDITLGCKNMKFSDLRCAPLNNRKFPDELNLEGSWLIGASFKSSILIRSNLKNVKAAGSSFRKAKLDGSDLSGADFTAALFGRASLKDIIVVGTNFDKVRGLTNDDKDYLNEQQAINVPGHLTEEEFVQESLEVKRRIRNTIGYKINKLIENVVRHPIVQKTAMGPKLVLDYTFVPIIKGSEKVFDYTVLPFMIGMEKAFDWTVVPVVKGTEKIFDYTVVPIVKGTDKVCDYTIAPVVKILGKGFNSALDYTVMPATRETEKAFRFVFSPALKGIDKLNAYLASCRKQEIIQTVE